MSLNSSSLSSYGALLAKTSKFAKEYDWNSAALLCQDYLQKNGEDSKVFELLGDYLYNSAFQQSTRDEFKNVILSAKMAYEKLSIITGTRRGPPFAHIGQQMILTKEDE